MNFNMQYIHRIIDEELDKYINENGMIVDKYYVRGYMRMMT